jgi:hypothetical protein
MDEHVLSTIIADDESEALLWIEEFDDALAFANDLGRHSATCTAAAKAAAATAAAEATAAAATAAAEAAAVTIVSAAAKAATVPVTAATTAAAVTGALLVAEFSADTLFTEIVALVAAAPAAVPLAPFIETHAPSELKLARLPQKPTRSGHMAQPVMARKTAHAPLTPLQENSARL